MSKSALYFAAATLSATLVATAARAGEDRASAYVMGEQAISQITTYAGYDVVDIELDGDVYRVKAFEPAGKRVELRYLAEDASLLSVQDGRSGDPFDTARD